MSVQIKFMSLLILPVLLATLSFVLQPDTGSIEGTVTDQWGPVAEAMITARNVMTGEVKRTRSNPVGDYAITSVRQGHYTLWVEAADHDSLLLMRVFVERGAVTRQDVFISKRLVKETQPTEELSR